MKKPEKQTETQLSDEYRLSNWDWNFAKNIVTFGELFLKPSDMIRPESTGQFNIKISWTIIDNVHVSSVK